MSGHTMSDHTMSGHSMSGNITSGHSMSSHSTSSHSRPIRPYAQKDWSPPRQPTGLDKSRSFESTQTGGSKHSIYSAEFQRTAEKYPRRMLSEGDSSSETFLRRRNASDAEDEENQPDSSLSRNLVEKFTESESDVGSNRRLSPIRRVRLA